MTMSCTAACRQSGVSLEQHEGNDDQKVQCGQHMRHALEVALQLTNHDSARTTGLSDDIRSRRRKKLMRSGR